MYYTNRQENPNVNVMTGIDYETKFARVVDKLDNFEILLDDFNYATKTYKY